MSGMKEFLEEKRWNPYCFECECFAEDCLDKDFHRHFQIVTTDDLFGFFWEDEGGKDWVGMARDVYGITSFEGFCAIGAADEIDYPVQEKFMYCVAIDEERVKQKIKELEAKK